MRQSTSGTVSVWRSRLLSPASAGVSFRRQRGNSDEHTDSSDRPGWPTDVSLASRLRSNGAGTLVLLITGWPSPAIAARAAELSIKKVLLKLPVEDELLRFVDAHHEAATWRYDANGSKNPGPAVHPRMVGQLGPPQLMLALQSVAVMIAAPLPRPRSIDPSEPTGLQSLYSHAPV